MFLIREQFLTRNHTGAISIAACSFKLQYPRKVKTKTTVKYLNSRKAVPFYIAAITVFLLLMNTESKAQISLQAGAGVAYQQSPTLAGHLAVSYRFKKLESSFNMLSLPFKKPTYMGITEGYALTSGDWEIKPYAGINYKITGSNKSQDRYMHNGLATTLSTGNEVNRVVGSFGMMIMKGVGYVDASYMDHTFGVTIGLRYTFNQD